MDFGERGPLGIESPFLLGRWRVDPRKNVVEAAGHRVHVEPKAMRVLLHLARRAGEDVSREALLEAVWRGAPVSASALTNAVWELRKALGDDRNEPDYIQTVSGTGYRLVAAVAPAPRERLRERPGAKILLYALGLVLSFLLGLGIATLSQ